MFRALMLAVGLSCALPLAVKAQEGEKKQDKRPPLTEEQKKQRKEILDKYDKNKDGKLDQEEKKAISAEDKEKLSKLRGRGGQPKP